MRPIFAIIVATMMITSCFADLRTSSTDDSRPQLPSPSPSPRHLTRLRTSTSSSGLDYTKSRRGVFPFVVPYPDGFDESEPKVLPVARQFEANGTFTDLYISGNTVSYDADCVSTGSSKAATDKCAAKQGKPPDPKKALALDYQRMFEKKAVRVTGADWFKGKVIVKDPRVKQ